MNWIKRKVIAWIYNNTLQKLFSYVKAEKSERVYDKIRLYNLINRKHADNAEQIEQLDAMLQMLASELGLEFKAVEETPEHIIITSKEANNE